jgi:hypothetical protein
MIKGTTGVVAAMAVWIGGAMSAEAQNIDVTITGPSNIATDTTSMNVTASVNLSTYMYWVRVKLNGVTRAYSGFRSGASPAISYPIASMETWLMDDDDVIEISVKAWNATSNDTDIDLIDVDPPSYYGMVPSNATPFRVPALQEERVARLSREELGVNA